MHHDFINTLSDLIATQEGCIGIDLQVGHPDWTIGGLISFLEHNDMLPLATIGPFTPGFRPVIGKTHARTVVYVGDIETIACYQHQVGDRYSLHTYRQLLWDVPVYHYTEKGLNVGSRELWTPAPHHIRTWPVVLQ